MYFVTVVLKKDVAFLEVSEVDPVLVLAVVHKGVPHLVVALVLDDLHVVEPVLHMVALDLDDGLVELAGMEGLVGGSWDEVVERAERAVAAYAKLGVGMTLIVEDLELAANA